MSDHKRIVYDFEVVGVESMEKAMGSFSEKLSKLIRKAKTLQTTFKGFATTGKAAEQSIGSERAKIDREVSGARRKLVREVEQAELAATRRIAAARKALMKVKGSKGPKGAKDDAAKLELFKQKERVKAANKIRVAKKKAVLAAGRAEAAQDKLVARERLRLQKKSSRDKEKEIQKAARLERQQLKVTERAKLQSLKRVAREEARQFKASATAQRQRQRRVSGHVSRGLNAPFRAASTMGRFAGGTLAQGLALGGTVGVAHSLSGKMSAEQRAIALENASDGEVTKDKLLRRSSAMAKYSGKWSETEQLEGIGGFIAKTGDSKTAVANWGNFNKIALATDSTLADIAETAADVSQKFDIKGPEAMATAFAVMAEQGKLGSFELKDLATQFPRLGAAAKSFGLRGLGGLQQTTGFAQVARQSTGSSEMAATALENMFSQLLKKNTSLEKGKYGEKLSIYNKKGDTMSGTKSLDVLIPQLIRSVNGDVGKLTKILGQQGIRSISSLIPAYSDAFKATDGTKAQKKDAGSAAVADAIRAFTVVDRAKAKASMQKAEGKALGGSEVQMAKMVEEFKTEIGSKLLPVLVEAAPAFRELIPQIVAIGAAAIEVLPDIIEFGMGISKMALTALGWVAQNPILGAMAFVAGSIAKSQLVSSLASATGKLLSGVKGTDAASGVLKGTMSGLGTMMGVSGPVAGGLIALGAALTAAVYSIYAATKADSLRVERVNDVRVADKAHDLYKETGNDERADKRLEHVKKQLLVDQGGVDDFSIETKGFLAAWMGKKKGSDVTDTDEFMLSMDERKKIAQDIEHAQKNRRLETSKKRITSGLTTSEQLELGVTPDMLKDGGRVVEAKDGVNPGSAKEQDNKFWDERQAETLKAMTGGAEAQAQAAELLTESARRINEATAGMGTFYR